MSTKPSTIAWQNRNKDRVKKHKLKWWHANKKPRMQYMREYSKQYYIKKNLKGEE